MDDPSHSRFEKINIKHILAGVMLIVIFGLLITTYKINEVNTRAFAVYYGKNEVGIVREKEEALNILENIKNKLSKMYDIDIVLNDYIDFEEVHSKDNELTSIEELKDEIQSNLTFLVCGYNLVVDNKVIGATKTKEEIEEVVEEIKKPYIKSVEEDVEIKEVKFLEDIRIKEGNIPLNKIVTKDHLLKQLKTGIKETKIHVVEVGESLWTIATIYNMNVEELEEVNPDKDPGKLQIGDEVKLLVPKPMLTIATTEELKYKEKVNYEVKIEEDKNMYKTKKEVKVKGVNGENQILSKVIKHNGVVVDKEILQEKIIHKPIDELVVKGTKEVPKTAATGVFLMPTRGSVSSRFGMRNGRMHKGLDIAAGSGTEIKAADGGKVIFSGRRGAYGNLVEIDHGNGYKTRYAHCSSINVSNGQKVAKGDVIAKVGNTGRSTGAHLHFEVIKNGSNENPVLYIR